MKSFKQYITEALDVSNNPNFWKWFGDSAVVDNQGNPLVVYHGTWSRDGEVFDVFNTHGIAGGSHFGTSKAASDRIRSHGHLMPVYLSIKNPVRLEDRDSWGGLAYAKQLLEFGIFTQADYDQIDQVLNDHKGGRAANAVFREILYRYGYDGIIYTNKQEHVGSDSYIALEPTQIKSTLTNNGDFDPNNPDITK
jgi:hypothetical protein